MTQSYTPSQIADGILAGEITRDSAFVPLAEVEKLTRECDEARAEVERLTEWQSINHSEQHKLGWSMTEFCEGKRDHLHEMWERPPSLDYGIAHIEAEIKRLRAHNARLRARLKKRREPDTHPVEET